MGGNPSHSERATTLVAVRKCGLRDGQGLPDVSVDAAGLRQPARHGAHHVAVPVGEEAASKERLRAGAHRCKRCRRHEIAGVGVRVREGVNLTTQIGERPLVTGRTADEVGLVERLPAPDRNGKEREVVAVAHVGIAADPGRVDLPGEQHRGDFLIGPPLNQLHPSAERFLEVAADQCQQFLIVGQEDRGQAEAQTGIVGSGRRPKDGCHGRPSQELTTLQSHPPAGAHCRPAPCCIILPGRVAGNSALRASVQDDKPA